MQFFKKRLIVKRILNKIFWFAVACSVVSCSKQWSDMQDKPEKLPKMKEKVFVEKLDSIHSVRPRYFYSKIKVKYSTPEHRHTFKTSVNIVLDSAATTIISKGPIRPYEAYLDQKEIIISNKLEKCFTRKDISSYSELWGIALSFDNIQELVFGLPLGFATENKYHVINTPYEYVLSTHKKRSQKKSEKKHKSDIIYTYKLNSSANNLSSAHIYSPADSFKIDIQYVEWQRVENMDFPKEMDITLTGPSTESQIKLVYTKLVIGELRKVFINIPDNYEKCN